MFPLGKCLPTISVQAFTGGKWESAGIEKEKKKKKELQEPNTPTGSREAPWGASEFLEGGRGHGRARDPGQPSGGSSITRSGEDAPSPHPQGNLRPLRH